jgi:predicted RNA-binding protein associated with RNAse of E/G family
VTKDDIIEKVDFIRLETTEDNIISHVSYLHFYKDKVIVTDNYKANAIFVFNKDGKFLNRISNYGNGPHEYLDITDVDVTPGGLIVIKDNVKDVLLFFDTDGNFVKEREDIEGGMELAFIDEHSIAFDTFTSHAPTKEKFKGASLAVCDGDNNIQYLFGENIAEENVFNVRRPKCLYRYGNKTYFAPHWDKNIYEVTTDSIIAKYRIEFKPDDVLNYTFRTNQEFEDLIKKHPFFNGSFIEMKDYTLLKYSSNEKNSLCILYSHKDKKTYTIRNYHDNPLYAYLLKPNTLYKNNTIAEVRHATHVFGNKHRIESTLGKTQLTNKLLNDLNMDDNPIIFLFTIKNDISKYVIKQ